MQVVTFADRFSSVGGIERVQLDVCRRLTRRGHEITVLVKDTGELLPEWEAFATVVPVAGFTVRRDRPIVGVRRVVATARRAAAAKPDVLYVHRHAVVQSAWPAGLLARNAPVVCHLHAMAPPHRGRATRFLHGRVARFIAVSNAVARSWTSIGVAPSRLTIVPNGIDTDRFAPAAAEERGRVRDELGIARDAFVVVYTGRVVHDKGVHVLADAVAELAAADPDVHLLVVGADPARPQPDDEPAYLHDVARRAPASTTWVARRPDVRPALHAADVAVVPSVVPDPNPLGAIEPLACGVPVVASRIGGIPEQLPGPLAAGLVTPGEAKELARGLASLRWWRRDRPELARICRDTAVERFSSDRVADGVEAVLISARRSR